MVYDGVRYNTGVFSDLYSRRTFSPATIAIPTFIPFLKTTGILVKKEKKKNSERNMYIATFIHLQMEYNVRGTHRKHGDRRVYEESANRCVI